MTFGLSSSIPHKSLMQDTFDFIAPVVKLADKYEMETICESLIPRVEADWPVTLERWDLISSHIAAMQEVIEKRHQTSHDYDVMLDEILVEPAGVIRFGRAHAESVLPAAFYHLSRLSSKFDEDPKGEDDAKWTHLYEGGRTARRTLLRAEDYETLYAGQGAIKGWMQKVATFLPGRVWSATCEREGMKEGLKRCERSLWWSQELRPKLLDIFAEDEVDVLAHLQRTANNLPSGLCFYCEKAVQEHLFKLREGFWAALPKLFRLPAFDGPDSDDDCPF